MNDYNNDVDTLTIKSSDLIKNQTHNYEPVTNDTNNSRLNSDFRIRFQELHEPSSNNPLTQAYHKPSTVPSKKRPKKIYKKSTETQTYPTTQTTLNSPTTFNQHIYNNISSLFNIQTSQPIIATFNPNPNESKLSYLLPLYLSEIRNKCENLLFGHILNEMLNENNYALNTIKGFCEFLNRNGYILRKREATTTSSSTLFTSPNNNANIMQNSDETAKSSSKRTKDIFNCPHNNRKHYAKNMCNNCYHKAGRAKLAWKCPHQKKPHYAKGMCQTCYLTQYHENKVINSIVELSSDDKII